MNDPAQDSGQPVVSPQKPPGPMWWRILRGAVQGFFADGVLSLSAALAFYTLLSIAPLLVLAVWVGSMTGYDLRHAVLGQVASTAGSNAGTAVASIFDSTSQHRSLGTIAGIASIVVALTGATTVFAQLQKSLNQIWGIRARPGHAIWGWLRQRVLSLGVIAAAAFVMVVSLVVSAALGMLLARSGPAWDVINQVISAVVMAWLFALLFRYMPDARLPWRTVLRGAVVTAALFTVGMWLIGIYLSSGSVAGAYGAAGSLVILLVWVYYSGAIFLFGAEVVRAWARERGETPQPLAHAETDT